MAISSKRSSYGKDVLDLLLFRRLSTGAVHESESFFNAAAKTPQTFNSFYIDNKHIAEYTSGLLPIRPANVDPGLPTKGTGQYEWQGFLVDDDAHSRRRSRATGRSSTGTTSSPTASAPPTTTGAATARSPAWTC